MKGDIGKRTKNAVELEELLNSVRKMETLAEQVVGLANSPEEAEAGRVLTAVSNSARKFVTHIEDRSSLIVSASFPRNYILSRIEVHLAIGEEMIRYDEECEKRGLRLNKETIEEKENEIIRTNRLRWSWASFREWVKLGLEFVKLWARIG